MSDAFIGLTIVAIGTSAPELATAIIAGIRNERDIAIGNLFGSSVYNILAILGAAAVAAPGGLAVNNHLLRFDFPAMLFVSLLCVPVFMTGHRVSRSEGAFFMGLYVLYLGTVIITRT
ncbi:MAG: hypothetical protein V9E94_07850 [Microthrixaceae bacterium]